MNRHRQFINRILAVFVFLPGLVSGAIAQETSALVRSDELTVEQRQRWREALEWPTHCEGGTYAWDDENHPVVGFLDAGDDRYLVYNVCGWSPYEINLFLVETDRPTVKPRLLTFKVLFPVYDPDPNPDPEPDPDFDIDLVDLLNNASREEQIRVTRKWQERVRYEAKMTSLIKKGGTSVDDQGRLVIDKRDIMSGTCGTYSIYDLDYDPPKLVGFRAQDNCLGSSDIKHWKSYSQEYIDKVPLVK